ncbi:MAG: 5-(carboxyamino)imidazole ribonucleotide synthase [Moraxella sp.]|nr:5-(carboxyamino)imidazole ribonucleotide synthase [Moraxella sp.]
MTHSNSPIRTIGILGGGQLGMMMARSAMQLGFRCVFLEDTPYAPASLYGQVHSTHQLSEFIAKSDIFTLEFENTPVATAQFLANLTDKGGIYPPPNALAVAQDRLAEKALFNQLDVPTVPYRAVNSQDELQTACDELGLPLVVKTSRGGYDGKGQFVIRRTDDIAVAWRELGAAVSTGAMPAPLIAEGFIDFSREVSLIAVRSKTGEIAYYPLVENHHTDGILAKTLAPAPACDTLTPAAQHSIAKIMHHLDYVGVMTLELFVSDTGLIANEIAPRVHNSGHWSIEGAVCSQFENHMRAVLGLPLGDTSITTPSVMLNVIGKYPNEAALLAIDGVHYHHYHKDERAGRKIAHITLTKDLDETIADVERLLCNG